MYHPPIANIAGNRYYTLTVQDNYKIDHYKHGTKIKWECKCDCGNILWCDKPQLEKRKQMFCDNCRPVARRNRKLYRKYHGMIQRCYNKNDPGYDVYGGRGIRVCDEWLDKEHGYERFEQWAISTGYGLNDRISIDRIDNDKGYSPDNCQWLTIADNTAKSDIGRFDELAKSHTRLEYTYAIKPSGERVDIKNIAQFCREYGFGYPWVGAALRGYGKADKDGWKFYSNKSRLNESVTTIENA